MIPNEQIMSKDERSTVSDNTKVTDWTWKQHTEKEHPSLTDCDCIIYIYHLNLAIVRRSIFLLMSLYIE